jgi:hypothetical protein
MMPGEGVDRHLDRHQDCPEANTILNHLSTYRNHFCGDPKDPYEYHVLREQIRAQYITPNKQREVAEKFLVSQGRGCEWAGDDGRKMFVEGKSRDALILGCACCGIRTKDNDNSYIKEPLSELGILKLTEEETKEHLGRIKSLNVPLPSDNTGKMSTFHLWKAWSIWPQEGPSDGSEEIDYYFLHPEFVESLGQYTESEENCHRRIYDTHFAWMCASCHKDVKKGIIPSLSIKAGIDYGSYHV